MIKVRQKVSGGFRTQKGARLFLTHQELYRNPQKTVPRRLDGADECHHGASLHSFRRLIPRSLPGDPCIFPSTSSFSEADAPLASVKEGGE